MQLQHASQQSETTDDPISITPAAGRATWCDPVTSGYCRHRYALGMLALTHKLHVGYCSRKSAGTQPASGKGWQCPPKLKLCPPQKKNCGRPATNKTKCRPIVLTSTPIHIPGPTVFTFGLNPKCNATCDLHILPL